MRSSDKPKASSPVNLPYLRCKVTRRVKGKRTEPSSNTTLGYNPSSPMGEPRKQSNPAQGYKLGLWRRYCLDLDYWLASSLSGHAPWMEDAKIGTSILLRLGSGHEVMDDVTVDVGEAELAPLEAVS